MNRFSSPDMNRIGVIGAGTMGSGIALAALLGNLKVVLYDVEPSILDRAHGYIEEHLNRKRRAINIQYLKTTMELEDVQPCGVVIEAAPEELSLKQKLFEQLGKICAPPTILATNTSTLPVTAITAAAHDPGRAGGMHFFNPAPVMPLVEVVRGAQTSPETIQYLVSLAEKMGKTPVVARDTPGFIVNRVARPFYGEALRLLSEGAATFDQIDRVIRLGGGFRMGPFQLMDLIGIDINFAATQSMYAQTFEEPRYRPSLIQAQMVQKKALGKKTGHGFYDYHQDGSLIEEQRAPLSPLPQDSIRAHPVLIRHGSWAPGIIELFKQKGYHISALYNPSNQPDLAVITIGVNEGLENAVVTLDQDLPPEIPLLCQCCNVTLTEIATWVEHPARLVGFDSLFFANGPIATLVPSPALYPQARAIIEDMLTRLGKEPVWITDSPGLILPRVIGMLANEAAFAFAEGVAPIETIDKAMQLGTSYPRGPLAWAKEIGYSCIVEVLDRMHAEYGEERYRVTPLLRRWARLNQVSA
ncbi:MAG: 3-hydroxyacyl-CoA dehydrogenase NAD-binding domain-containing protein [Omnitrophica WOR_2 bacterium]